MVTKQDIEHIGRLMRIDIDNANEHFERVQIIMNYFEILDKADIEGEAIPIQQITIDELRADQYIPFDGKLISQLRNYKENFIRAPKMN